MVDSRVAGDGFSIRRRRECLKCSFRYSTYESIEILDITVVKRDGRKEPYNRDKIISGLKRSLEKRPITDEDFKKLVSNIERSLQAERKSELTSEQVGRIIMKHLKKQDKIAYIRFASVYQEFPDIDKFQEELDKLIRRKSGKKPG